MNPASMNPALSRILFAFLFAAIAACSSGKKAYDRGDYYDAVVKAVTRLKQKPDHDKSKETLKGAYPLAVQNLEQEASNLLASAAPFRYKNAISVYQRINQLGDFVRSSPAALSVIRQPKSYHEKIGELKEKAADELYEAGIQSMMKGTRNDSKQAYFYFKECEEFVPKFKEALEMMTRAEDDATIKVLYDESSFTNWTTAANVIRNLDNMQFVSLFSKNMSVNTLETNSYHLNMLISIKEYKENRPDVKRTEFERRDSVKVGEKVVNNKKVPVYEKVKGKFIHHQAVATAVGWTSVIIKDNKNGNIVFNQDFQGKAEWREEWGTSSGDQRALTKNDKRLLEKGVQKPDFTNLKNAARADVEQQMFAALSGFLRDY